MNWSKWTRAIGYGSGVLGAALLTSTSLIHRTKDAPPPHQSSLLPPPISSTEISLPQRNVIQSNQESVPPRSLGTNPHLPVSQQYSLNTGTAQLEDSIQRADDLCRKIKEKLGLPGLSVAVSVNGQVVWKQGFGYANVENAVPMTSESVIRIASISKTMTMAMLAQLMEQGKIDLDAPIQKYIPTFPQKTFDSEPVTITTRHLLSHLSGIRHYQTKAEVDKANKEKKTSNNNNNNGEGDSSFLEFFMQRGCKDVSEALEIFQNDELFHKPGSKYLYTTHGWTVVSAIIEKLTEKPFTTHAKDMFDHWGLKNTYLDEHGPIIYNRASHYTRDRKGILSNSPWVNNSCKWAGGGFLSNVEDLLRFSHIMLYSKQQPINAASGQSYKNGEGASSKGFLRPETMDQIWTGNEATSVPNNDNLYAMGFVVAPPSKNCNFCKERDLFHVSHSGGAVGATSILLMAFPEQKNVCHQETRQESSKPLVKGVSVAMITNITHAGLSKTAREISDLFKWMI